MASASGSRAMMYLKKGWNEWPDLVFSIGLSIAGALLTGVAVYRFARMGEAKNMYKMQYTVMREEDVDDPKKKGTLYN